MSAEERQVAHTPPPWAATQSNPAEGFDVWWITSADAGNYEKEIGSVAGGSPTGAANAAHIVLCVNSHKAMREALEELALLFEKAGKLHPTRDLREVVADPAHLAIRIRAVLAKAEPST